MPTGGRRGGWLLFSVVVTVGATSAGCANGCDVSCTDPASLPPPTVVNGRVVSVDDRVVTIESDEGQLVVEVFGGHPRALDAGSSYRIPIHEDDSDGDLQARLPSDCDCGGPYITRPDGDEVDQSITGFDFDLKAIASIAGGVFICVALAWGVVRRVRGA